jgi:hypothetical protein
MYMLKLLQYLSGKIIIYLGEKMVLKHFSGIPVIYKNYLLQVEIEKLYEESKERPIEHDENEFVIIDFEKCVEDDIYNDRPDTEIFSDKKPIPPNNFYETCVDMESF